MQSLAPLDSSIFGEGPSELTIFEVVKRKYREKWEMLLPYLKKK